MPLKITKQTARKFLLQKQLLWPPQRLRGINGITKVFNTLRAIQYDPQNPCGRNVDLVLQARVDNIHTSDYYKWLYEQKKGIEFYDKELCVLPIEDLPLCRKHYKASRKRRYDSFVSKYRQELDRLLNKIRTTGSICSKDIQDSRKIDLFWAQAQWGRVALETLWKNGKLVIINRQNGRKYYDLPKRVYGNKFQWSKSKYENQLHYDQILRRIQSIGMLTTSGTGQGWLGVGTGREIKPLIRQMIEEKKLIEIKIQGIKSSFIINTHDRKIFDQLSHTGFVATRIVFLGPLDNLLWDRTMIKDIFNFEYKWEAYTPKKDRKFGHYVLPILFGDEFIGRIEPFLQKDKTLEMKGFWLEKGIKITSALRKVFPEYLQKFQKYLKAERIIWKAKRKII